MIDTGEEYWVKVLDFQPDELELLDELGFQQAGREVFIEDIYFTHRLFDFRKRGYQIRLRRVVEAGELELVEWAWKSRLNSAGTRETKKLKTQFIHFGYSLFLLKLLLLRVDTRRQKKRVTYKKGGLEVQIDSYPNIPTYAEITGPKNECQQLLTDMAVNEVRITHDTASGVFARYGITNSRRILFPD